MANKARKDKKMSIAQALLLSYFVAAFVGFALLYAELSASVNDSTERPLSVAVVVSFLWPLVVPYIWAVRLFSCLRGKLQESAKESLADKCIEDPRIRQTILSFVRGECSGVAAAEQLSSLGVYNTSSALLMALMASRTMPRRKEPSNASTQASEV